MAVIKHIKSRNADYGAALHYLLFQHDESTGKVIKDEYGRELLREEYYIDGLNCEPMFFDQACKMTNQHFNKNRNPEDLKSHHYIISFDPEDISKCGLTGKRAHELCLDFARKNFPGYEALVVTHTDGHNHSGNIHTHIVINSVRKYAVDRKNYMVKPHEESAGFKHRASDLFTRHLKRELMAMCEREGLHQLDLLSPAEVKISQGEYVAKRSGQKKLEKNNKRILEDGLTPSHTEFGTNNQYLRNAIEECAKKSRTMEEFKDLLFERYQISATERRGRMRYRLPDAEKYITDKALGSRYGPNHLRSQFFKNFEKDPLAVLTIRTHLRLVVDLQTNVKAMQSRAYAQKVKISNLKEMAQTILYVQENGYDSLKDLERDLNATGSNLKETKARLEELSSEIHSVNEQIRYTGQYLSNKTVYKGFLKSRSKRQYRQEHLEEITAYEEAREKIRIFSPDGKIPLIKDLKAKKTELKREEQNLKYEEKELSTRLADLQTADANAKMILDEKFQEEKLPKKELTEKQKTTEYEL